MIWLLSWLLLSAPSFAQNTVFEPVVVKHKEKVQRRWTLEDWFTLKRKRRSQDQWLAWNSKRGPIFELILDVHGGSPSFKRDGTDPLKKDFRWAGGGVQIFIGPVGVSISREQDKIKDGDQYWTHDSGTLFLRLVGSSTQTTHFTLLGGKEKSDHEYYGKFDQTFYGALANLYLFQHMGFEGQFKQKSSATTDTHRISSTAYHWGMFWELSILRLYLVYQQEFNRAKRLSDDVKDNERINGAVMGARLYF